MVFILKKGADKKEIEQLRERLSKQRKGVDIKKYSGTLKLAEDLLIIQKRLHDERE